MTSKIRDAVVATVLAGIAAAAVVAGFGSISVPVDALPVKGSATPATQSNDPYGTNHFRLPTERWDSRIGSAAIRGQ